MRQLTVLLSFLISISGWAQPLSVTYSEPFDKVKDMRTFQCGNGNTLLFKSTNEEGKTVDVYDKSRKLIAHTQCTYQLFPLENSEDLSAKGICQIRGNAVEFIASVSNDEKSLYRIIYSSETGKVIQEDKIATMPKHGKQRMFGVVNAGLWARFQVVVDPQSEAYAVFLYDDRSDDAAKKIELIHFNKEHKEIGRGFYNGSVNNYDLLNYVGMVVRGTDDVILLTYGYKNALNTCTGTQLLLSRFKSNAFEHHVIPGCRSMQDPSLISFRQNAKSNYLELLAVYQSAASHDDLRQIQTNTFESRLVSIDPSDFSVKSELRLDGRLASQYRKTHYGVKRDFYGIPISAQENADGSSTLVMQEMVSGNFQYTGDIGVVNFNAEGKPINGTAIRHRASSAMDNDFHQIRLIGSPSNYFVIFNDHPANFAADPQEEAKQLMGIGAADAICYQIKDGNMNKLYLFGEPNSDFDNRYADVRADNYSETLKTYAVPMVERRGHKNTYRLAWVQIL